MYQDGIHYLLMGYSLNGVKYPTFIQGSTAIVKLAYCKDGEFFEVNWHKYLKRRSGNGMEDISLTPNTQSLIVGKFEVLNPNRDAKGYPQIQILPTKTASILKLGWKGETVSDAERAAISHHYSSIQG